METKTELLDICELEELKILDKLGKTGSRMYIADWFGESQGDDINEVDITRLRLEYLEDFMRWQGDKSPEELKEVIKGQRNYRKTL